MPDDFLFWYALIALIFYTGHLHGRLVPSKHATFIERRKNPRNEAIWTDATRERFRIRPIDMVAAGGPWKEQ